MARMQEYRSATNRQQYDVAPDDRQFVMIRAIGAAVPNRLVYVENFFEELQARGGELSDTQRNRGQNRGIWWC